MIAPHHNMIFADNGVPALWGIPSSRIQRLGSKWEFSQSDGHGKRGWQGKGSIARVSKGPFLF